MKSKLLLSVIAITVLNMEITISQITPSVTRVSLLEKDRAILDQHISEYAVFKIDKRELIDSLYTKGSCIFRLLIDEKRDWVLEMQFNDMRAPDYRQTYISDEGEFEVEPHISNIFKGTTSDNRVARFTIDEKKFFGIILYDKEHYVIRPVKDFTQNCADESLIVFKNSDIITQNENFEYITDEIIFSENEKDENGEQNMTKNSSTGYTCKWYLKIATDADYDFFVKRGYDLISTYDSIFTILNIAEGIYESTFNMNFLVTYQNVYTTDIIYTKTDYEKLMDQFRDQWEKNRKSVPRNVAHLFTGKVLSDALGYAYKIGHINDSKSYSLSMDYYQNTTYSRQTEIFIHELGHNLNATHPPSTAASGECVCYNLNNPSSIMCPYNSGTEPQNLWFCGYSISEILEFIHSKQSILQGNISNSLSLSGSITGFNSYEATQSITSTQIVNSGFTSYETGQIINLLPGFKANVGSVFKASIRDISGCENWAPINVVGWTGIVCPGTDLQFNVTNATAYFVEIFSLSGQLFYSGRGGITGNPVVVWNVPAHLSGLYLIKISFYSPQYKVSNSYHLLFECSKATVKHDTENEEEQEISLKYTAEEAQDDDFIPFSFSIFPNPTSGFVTINYTLHVDAPICIELFNLFGQRLRYILPPQNKNAGVYSVQTSVSDLGVGAYVIKVTCGEQSETKQLIIDK